MFVVGLRNSFAAPERVLHSASKDLHRGTVTFDSSESLRRG